MTYSIAANARELENLLVCPHCRGAVRIDGSQCVCTACGRSQEILEDAIITDDRLRQSGDAEDLQYSAETKRAYQSHDMASLYLRRYKYAYSYPALIALRERQCVAAALKNTTGVSVVLDLPAGTGKLAPVHRRFGYDVIAGDASAHMLQAGLGAEWAGHPRLLGAIQTDVTTTNLKDGAVDCAVCLRLMHRLPVPVIRAGLAELARVSRRWIIVSNGTSDSGIMRFARRPKPKSRAKLTRQEWTEILTEFGDIVSEHRVLPGISTELVTLLRKREG